jgi:hypothetical protein
MSYNLLLDSDLLRYANIGLTEDDTVRKERVANITESEICEVLEIFNINTQKIVCNIDDRQQVEINN